GTRPDVHRGDIEDGQTEVDEDTLTDGGVDAVFDDGRGLDGACPAGRVEQFAQNLAGTLRIGGPQLVVFVVEQGCASGQVTEFIGDGQVPLPTAHPVEGGVWSRVESVHVLPLCTFRRWQCPRFSTLRGRAFHAPPARWPAAWSTSPTGCRSGNRPRWWGRPAGSPARWRAPRWR